MVESKKRGLYVSLGFGAKAGSGHYNFVLDHLSSDIELRMVSCELRVASCELLAPVSMLRCVGEPSHDTTF